MTIPRFAKKNVEGVWGNFVFDLSPGQRPYVGPLPMRQGLLPAWYL